MDSSVFLAHSTQPAPISPLVLPIELSRSECGITNDRVNIFYGP